MSFGSKKRALLLCALLMMFPAFAAWDEAWLNDCDYGEYFDFFNEVYVGAEGGWSTGLFTSNRSLRTGPLATANISLTHGMNVLAGYHVGANVGYIVSRCFRTDFSYTYLSNRVKWENQANITLTTAPHLFDARLQIHLLLANVYFHLADYLNNCLGFSPYLTAGGGVAFNHLGRITERNNLSVIIAHDTGRTQCHCAARFGFGILKPFCYQWALDAGFNINYIGTVISGNTQDLITGARVNMRPFKHSDVWIATCYLGLKYRI